MFRLEVEIPDLEGDLRALIRQIPPGRVATYGDLAAALGDARAARWVAGAVRQPEIVDDAPHHRVVRQTGEVSDVTGDHLGESARRLIRDGVEVRGNHLELEHYRFTQFQSSRPLARLAEYQRRLPARVHLEPLKQIPEAVAGLDVSYAHSDRAVAAYVLVETATGQPVWSVTAEVPARFPYITGYLSFRELPALLDVLNRAVAADRLASLLFIDGSGILHPRRAGIATNLGVVTQITTLGISKKLLCGQVDLTDMALGESRPVVYRGETRGAAVLSRPRSKPVFVSPGNGIDVPGATAIVQRLFHGHRLPEPTWHADALSRRVAQEIKARG